ncbi:hypothetical protein N7475_010188 [Penicillium sp. IBT 31633x]|nr:hypothetical protein N7475_010188 [Penicillium sp. IBT 31633x]
MAPLTITLDGQSSVRRNPERAMVFLDVTCSNNSRQTARNDATDIDHNVQRTIKNLFPEIDDGAATADSAVLTFSATNIRIWTSSSTGDMGQPENDRSYYAQITYQLLFRDFTKINRLLDKLATHGVSLAKIEWLLTENTKTKLVAESRIGAMRDANNKAKEYARILGLMFHLEALTFREVRPSMTNVQNSLHIISHQLKHMYLTLPNNPGLSWSNGVGLSPQDVEIISTVEVGFRSTESGLLNAFLACNIL